MQATLSVQGGLGLSTDSAARVMKAGPQAPAPGRGLCAWRLSQRRALQHTEPNQKWKLSKKDENHNKNWSALCGKISEHVLFC